MLLKKSYKGRSEVPTAANMELTVTDQTSRSYSLVTNGKISKLTFFKPSYNDRHIFHSNCSSPFFKVSHITPP
jgi:hypothetical protein